MNDSHLEAAMIASQIIDNSKPCCSGVDSSEPYDMYAISKDSSIFLILIYFGQGQIDSQTRRRDLLYMHGVQAESDSDVCSQLLRTVHQRVEDNEQSVSHLSLYI